MGANKYLKVRCPYCYSLIGVYYMNMHLLRYHRDRIMPEIADKGGES